MSHKYVDEEEEELIKDVDKKGKYSKNIFLGSLLGFGAIALNYYFSNNLGLETLDKSLGEMNNNELIHTAILSASSLGTVGGGVIYGMFAFMKKDLKDRTKKKNNLEKTLKN